MSVACGGNPAEKARSLAFKVPRGTPLEPFDVRSVIVERTAEGVMVERPHVGVIFTQPVTPTPASKPPIRLVDQDDQPIAGTARWIDPQILVFEPVDGLPIAKILELQLTAPLVAEGGATLSPRPLLTLRTMPHQLVSSGPMHSQLFPVSPIQVRFDVDVGADEVAAHGLLTFTDDKTPIPFTVAVDGEKRIVISPKVVLTPGRTVRFAWKEGRILASSVGTLELPPLEIPVSAVLLVLIVGEPSEDCKENSSGSSLKLFTCSSNVDYFHLILSAPITAAELEAHVHVGKKSTVALAGAVDGKSPRLLFRGYEPSGPSRWITVTIDPELTDVFGQKLDAKSMRSLKVRGY